MEKGNCFFVYNISVGVLDLSTMELKRVNDVQENHFIFERIAVPFNFYYQNSIFVIPDSIPTPRGNWNKKIIFYGQEIECVGKYIFFFSHKKLKEGNFVKSLKLSEFEYVKKGISLE